MSSYGSSALSLMLILKVEGNRVQFGSGSLPHLRNVGRNVNMFV